MRKHASALAELATEHDLVQWMAFAGIDRGLALVAEGRVEDGITALERGIAANRATGANVATTHALGFLAGACLCAGRAEDGVAAVESALAEVEQRSERYFHAELLRLKAELLLVLGASAGARDRRGTAMPADRAETAESCARCALAIARRQQSKSLELRAATTLARLWQDEGKADPARQMLRMTLAWFTEGLDTGDLRTAHTLLTELGLGLRPTPTVETGDADLHRSTARPARRFPR